MTLDQQIVTVLAAGAATILTRALPFLVFPASRPVPGLIRYLGRALPGAIFALLVVYCLREVNILAPSEVIPQVAGLATATALFLWRRDMLIAIFGSTAVYLILVNLVFVS
ncbi:branched-chain amino acid transporter permease [Collinsella vaginalis]|uniref:branched-chain amino acid transporter permease n=1 Tax=Collinsella vaginalis TaxID=1870987 RepID=UPI000A266D24|nr:AzlD domain-containing protein [Collinsella vaginalis]